MSRFDPRPSHITPSTHYPINPLPHYPINPLPHQPITPLTHYPINPSTHHSTIPSTHYPITPLTHYPINPLPHHPINPSPHFSPYLFSSMIPTASITSESVSLSTFPTISSSLDVPSFSSRYLLTFSLLHPLSNAFPHSALI